MITLTSPHRTRYHDLPAGFKLASLCVLTVFLFSIDSLAVHLSAVAGIGFLYAQGGSRFVRAGVRGLMPLWPFVAVLAAWHAITGSLIAGIGIAAKLLAAVGLANLVTMTTRLDDILGVVRKLTLPFIRFGIRTGGLDLAVALVVRFTPSLLRKGQSLATAWRARSCKRTNWRIMVPLTLSAIDDAERVAEAIRARRGS